MIYVEGKKSFSFQFISLVIYACCKGSGGVSYSPPPFPPPSSPLSLHRYNLVIDDVKEEKVQQLEKSEKGLQFLWLHFIYHWCFSRSKGSNSETTASCTIESKR